MCVTTLISWWYLIGQTTPAQEKNKVMPGTGCTCRTNENNGTFHAYATYMLSGECVMCISGTSMHILRSTRITYQTESHETNLSLCIYFWNIKCIYIFIVFTTQRVKTRTRLSQLIQYAADINTQVPGFCIIQCMFLSTQHDRYNPTLHYAEFDSLQKSVLNIITHASPCDQFMWPTGPTFTECRPESCCSDPVTWFGPKRTTINIDHWPAVGVTKVPSSPYFLHSTTVETDHGSPIPYCVHSWCHYIHLQCSTVRYVI